LEPPGNPGRFILLGVVGVGTFLDGPVKVRVTLMEGRDRNAMIYGFEQRNKPALDL